MYVSRRSEDQFWSSQNYTLVLTLNLPGELNLCGLCVYYVVHICDFGVLRVKKTAELNYERHHIYIVQIKKERIMKKVEKKATWWDFITRTIAMKKNELFCSIKKLRNDSRHIFPDIYYPIYMYMYFINPLTQNVHKTWSYDISYHNSWYRSRKIKEDSSTEREKSPLQFEPIFITVQCTSQSQDFF